MRRNASIELEQVAIWVRSAIKGALDNLRGVLLVVHSACTPPRSFGNDYPTTELLHCWPSLRRAPSAVEEFVEELMSKTAFMEELKSVTVSVGAAVDGVDNGDWMKVELALFEVQQRTGRLLREISIVKPAEGTSLSGTDE